MKQMFLRLERATTALSMYFAYCHAGDGVRARAVPDSPRFVLEKPARVDRSTDPLLADLDGVHGHPDGVSPGAMVSVDVLYRWASDRHKRVLDAVVMLASLLLIAVIIIVGWDYSQRGACNDHWPRRLFNVLGLHLRCRWAGCLPCWALSAISSTRSGSNSKPHNGTRTLVYRHAHHDGAVLCTHHLGRRIHRARCRVRHLHRNVNMLVSVKEMFSSINKFPLAAIPPSSSPVT